MLERVLTRGDATWSEDQLLLLERRGYPEECAVWLYMWLAIRHDWNRPSELEELIEKHRRQRGSRPRFRTRPPGMGGRAPWMFLAGDFGIGVVANDYEVGSPVNNDGKA
jgi:hypothetical protein